MSVITDLLKKVVPKKKETEEEQRPYQFTDEDREKSAQLRLMRAELKKLEKETKLDELKEELEFKKEELRLRREKRLMELSENPNDSSSMEDKLMMLILAPILSKLGMNTLAPDGVISSAAAVGLSSSPLAKETAAASMSLSDDILKQLLGKVPKSYLKIAKKMQKEELELLIKNQLPLVDEDTINRAILLLKQ